MTEPALELRGLVKRFGDTVAVDGIDLDVPSGSFFGLVGPNGAGKTTTLSMATGLLRPDAGAARIHGVDVWANRTEAKRLVGVLSDGVRLFDRLTGTQLVTYSGLLRGMPRDVVVQRTADLLSLLDLDDAGGKLVVDSSAGMTKKIALACALIHAPQLLVLDEPFESVDPVSAANIHSILDGFVRSGGTVIISSHVMDLVQRMCDSVAVIARGRVLASGPLDEVRAGSTLEDRFVELVGGRRTAEGPEWLRLS
jgi:ABC-2 type transport system ATP-binding protein